MDRVCSHCGNEMREISYQARSADEAQRTIVECTSCPLDASRLNIFAPLIKPHVHLMRNEIRRSSTESRDITFTRVLKLLHIELKIHEYEKTHVA